MNGYHSMEVFIKEELDVDLEEIKYFDEERKVLLKSEDSKDQFFRQFSKISKLDYKASDDSNDYTSDSSKTVLENKIHYSIKEELSVKGEINKHGDMEIFVKEELDEDIGKRKYVDEERKTQLKSEEKKGECGIADNSSEEWQSDYKQSNKGVNDKEIFINEKTKGSQLKCNYCEKNFNNVSSLKMHLRIHTRENSLKCDYCGKSFASSGYLKSHLRIHTGEKPFKCDHCDKRFFLKEILKIHLRIHSGEKPFECDHCGKNFTKSGNLKIHLRIHTGEKPYKCDHCEKSFSHREILRSHLRNHTGEKPFICDHCGKSFTDRGILKRHLIIHSGEKLFKCDQCDKSFSHSETLKIHLRIHTGEKPLNAIIVVRVLLRVEI